MLPCPCDVKDFNAFKQLFPMSNYEDFTPNIDVFSNYYDTEPEDTFQVDLMESLDSIKQLLQAKQFLTPSRQGTEEIEPPEAKIERGAPLPEVKQEEAGPSSDPIFPRTYNIDFYRSLAKQDIVTRFQYLSQFDPETGPPNAKVKTQRRELLKELDIVAVNPRTGQLPTMTNKTIQEKLQEFIQKNI